MEKYLSREKYEELKKELKYLETEKRKEVAEAIRHAASFGDLSENAAYSDAKDAKSFLEGKIDELKDLLKNAKIMDESTRNAVGIGSKILASSDNEELNFEIASSIEANPAFGKISYESPFGKAFLGKKKGAIVEVKTPEGKTKYKRFNG